MLRLRLNIGLWVILILLLATAGSGWYYMKNVEREVSSILSGSLARVHAAQMVRSTMIRLNTVYLLASAPKLVTLREEPLGSASAEIRKNATALTTNPPPMANSEELVTGLRREVEEYLVRIAAIAYVEPAEADKLGVMREDIARLLTSISVRIDEVLAASNAEMVKAQKRAAEEIRGTTQFMLLAILMACGVAFIHLSRVNRTVVTPIEELSEAAKEAGHGNLEPRLHVRSNDELGQLAIEFNSMLAKLRSYRQLTSDQIVRLNSITRALLSSFPDPIFVIDAAGKMELMNPEAERLCGILGEENALPREYLITKDAEEDSATGAPRHLTLRIQGEDRHYLPKLVTMNDDRERFLGHAVILSDITKLQLRDELKSKLVSTVSHEVKTPVTSIRMVIHMLLDGMAGPLAKEQRELLETGRDEVDRLLRLLQNLLEIAKYESGTPHLNWAECDAVQLCNEAVEQFQFANAEPPEVQTQFEEGLPAVLADPDLIRHALSNFLNNASKYSEPNTPIEVIAQAAPEGGVLFGVRDHGTGINAEHIERIFEKFYRVPGRKVVGTGLGLAIAREIITIHGGVIGCESTMGEGSFFFFRLPEASVARNRLGGDPARGGGRNDQATAAS